MSDALASPRFLVMGCGAIGGVLTAALAETGQDVTAVTTNESIHAAIRERGMKVVGDGASRIVRPKVSLGVPEGETFDPERIGMLAYAIAEHYAKLQSSYNTVRILEGLGDPSRALQLEEARSNALYHMGQLSHFVGDAAQAPVDSRGDRHHRLRLDRIRHHRSPRYSGKSTQHQSRLHARTSLPLY